MKYFLLVPLSFLVINCWATTWGPVYPYTQKTENGRIKTYSVPYEVYSGPYGIGETFVFSKGKLLYTVDKYFSSPFLTVNNGEFLVEFRFWLDKGISIIWIDENGEEHREPPVYNGNAVNIFKSGELIKTIRFSELNVDPAKINISEVGNQFSWKYSINDTVKDKLRIKMHEHSAFVERQMFYLITADNQLISIDVANGKIANQPNALSILQQKPKWNPSKVRRKHYFMDYPEKFYLPKLVEKETIEAELAQFLGLRVADGYNDSVVLQVYFNRLLVNKQGKCEDIYISVTKHSGLTTDLKDKYESVLRNDIENWVRKRTFDTSSIPKKLSKYCYSDFIYLKL